MSGELYDDIAPISVENFEKLANSGFYDGLIFHRV
ncbi:MAG: peptidylprolyl isomerase, partial [Lachnospiraceae bacterium]|nr:peptidylprolyl isomerase [Lachnospiraceae bacterium]